MHQALFYDHDYLQATQSIQDNTFEEQANVEYKTWSQTSSKLLIELYKKYRQKVGSFQIKNMKRLWEVIAGELNNILHHNMSPGNCENRWRVLERNYKKFIDNNNKTGRGRKDFEFSKEMDEIFLKKRNVHPEILLSQRAETITSNSNLSTNSTIIANYTNIVDTSVSFNDEIPIQTNSVHESESHNDNQNKQNKNQTKSKKIKKTRNGILYEMKQDRLKYQENIIRIKKENAEKNTEMEEKKLQEIKIRNKLIEKRNNLLREFLQKGLNLPPGV